MSTAPLEANGLHLYRVRIVEHGKMHTWERYGATMEEALTAAKAAAVREFGEIGSIAICGQQGNSGVYAF